MLDKRLRLNDLPDFRNQGLRGSRFAPYGITCISVRFRTINSAEPYRTPPILHETLYLLQASVAQWPPARTLKRWEAVQTAIYERPMILIQHFGETTMQGENLELWQTLCAEAAREQDPERLMQLVQEIDRMLSEKELRLKENLQTQK